MDAKVAIDLHIHSTLRPAAPRRCCRRRCCSPAAASRIGVVASWDHCCARNAWAFVEAAPAFEVRVFVGLEVESAENVHLLALFDSVAAAMEMDRIVSEHLPPLKNRADLFGRQILVDEWGESIGIDDRLLVTATDLPVERVAGLTHELGGMSMPPMWTARQRPAPHPGLRSAEAAGEALRDLGGPLGTGAPRTLSGLVGRPLLTAETPTVWRTRQGGDLHLRDLAEHRWMRSSGDGGWRRKSGRRIEVRRNPAFAGMPF